MRMESHSIKQQIKENQASITPFFKEQQKPSASAPLPEKRKRASQGQLYKSDGCYLPPTWRMVFKAAHTVPWMDGDDGWDGGG